MGPFPFGARTRSLVWELTKREVAGRYRGMSLGVVWSLVQPFLMLGVYTLAFGEILGARWPGAADTADFAVILFVGIIVHAFLAECITKAPMLIAGNVSYVKRVVFPLDVLPWPVLFSGVFHFASNVVVLLLCLKLLGHDVPATVLFLPVVVLPLGIVALGAMWLLSSLAVYFRDVNQLVGPLTTAMFFISSAIVPVDVVPQRFRLLFELNPITLIVDNARRVVLDGALPDWRLLGLYTLLALAFMLVGYLTFARLRRGFANVL